MTSPLAYLSQLCRRWGGMLLLLPRADFRSMARCSGFTGHPDRHHAIDRGQRLVIADRRRANPGTIVHEMGHVFLDEGNPVDCYEPDWLGWEIVLARMARCYRIWSMQNADYELANTCGLPNVSWGWLTNAEKQRVIADRIDYAKAIGIVNRDGEPLCTRGIS